MAFPKAMRRASRCSSMSRPGSNAIIRMSSAPRSSTASPWASTSRPSWCAMRASTASRCGRPMSISAHGIARWSRAADGAQHRFAVRLGFRQVQGLNEDELNKLIAARGNGYASIERLAAVAGVSRFTIERLAEADAFRSMGLDRRAALWAARRLDTIGIKHEVRTGTVDAAPAPCPAYERGSFPGAGDRAAAHAAARACGGGLCDDRPVAEGASRQLLPRPAGTARRHAQRGSSQRGLAAEPKDHRCRPRADAADARAPRASSS